MFLLRENPCILAIAVAVSLLAALTLELLQVPADAMIGAMVAIATLSILGFDVPRVSSGGRFAVFVAIGWLLGADVQPGLMKTFTKAAVPIAIAVVALLVAGGVLAWVVHRVGDVDIVSALLATSPGGLTQMAVLASDTGADVPLVVGLHFIRVFSVLVLTPVAVKALGT